MFRIIDITKKNLSSCCFDLENLAMEFPTATASSSYAKTHCASLKQEFYSACQTNKFTETVSISCTVGDIYVMQYRCGKNSWKERRWGRRGMCKIWSCRRVLRLEKRNRKVSYYSVDFYVTSISCDPWYCDIY